ncbi:nucleotidyltransferase family protein [Chelatococcus sambhunathii]|uniref:Nucleotidyltransferase family protein n=1 Tax=Chelatococcus sambhunathii TaxID=363953 RepID=A0ABU1DI15_9HYPH|nr:nucleotidyltransferase family protein [Chelatococcus sambhunathii]MDR4307755.1 nucleotidyltransferase family protein [Chelatococcus sambhunathii]
MTSALILAGVRKGGDRLAEFAGVEHKALIPIGGRPMIERVIAALRASGRIDRILVSVNRPKALKDLDVEVIKAADTLSQSVVEGVTALGTPALVTTADHALLEPEWVRYFLDNLPDAQIAAGIARSEVVMGETPDTKRTFLKLADGSFSGCNLFFLRDMDALRGVALWREFEALRKRPLKMLQKLGPRAILAAATGRLTTDRVAAEVQRLSGLTAGKVEMPFGRAAIDVDKPEDLILVRRLVGDEAA